MRVALVHPIYWPEVHRGSERIVHDTASGLARRGHEVTIVTTHPGPRSESLEDGFRVIRDRRPPRLPGMGLHEHFLETLPAAVWQLVRGSYQVAHAFFPSSGLAAVEARRLGGPPSVFSFHGIPTRRYLVARRYRLSMLRRLVERSRATTVLSEAAAEPFRRYLLRDPIVLPAGVSLEEFRPAQRRHEKPTLLCAASFTDPRKRVRLLLEVFAELHSHRPEVRLQLADNPDPTIAAERPSLPAGAEWLDLNRPGALREAYARAWATVLPSVDEAQGLVLVESLASGTPVVAARSGACPEVVTSDRVGRLFEPDDPDTLREALVAALELGAGGEATVEACRSRAADFAWGPLLDRHEQLYESALAG
jgi:glycosyltransferase involved in cell wall biosynthesis